MEDVLNEFDDIDLLVARTAEEGIELARDRHPAIIILDINLPGMSGLDALSSLRRLPETAQIPVIALTAAATARDLARGEAAGFYRYLTKPLRVADFEAILESLFASHADVSA